MAVAFSYAVYKLTGPGNQNAFDVHIRSQNLQNGDFSHGYDIGELKGQNIAIHVKGLGDVSPWFRLREDIDNEMGSQSCKALRVSLIEKVYNEYRRACDKTVTNLRSNDQATVAEARSNQMERSLRDKRFT